MELIQRQYRYLPLITSLYITFQLIADVTASKITVVFGYSIPISTIYFPITYIFADILTEVYGYAVTRRTIWMVLVCSVIAGTFYQFVVFMPPAPGFLANESYRAVFGQVPRILLGGWIAVFAGEILNSYVLAKMKVLCNGKWLWLRTIGSTVVGQLANSIIFCAIGLYGVIPNELLFQVIYSSWLLKVLVEAVMTPVTYCIIDYLKRTEDEDYYDKDTDFNPFVIA